MMKNGFTLVEIMIVVSILAILSAIAIPNFARARKDSLKKACIANMKLFAGGIEMYAINGQYPTDINQVVGILSHDVRKSQPHFACPACNLEYALPSDGDDVTCPGIVKLPDHVFMQ